MISGEKVSVPRKYKEPLDKKHWRSKGIIAGNQWLHGDDSSNQLGRRFIFCNFKEAIRNPDPNKASRMLEKSPSALVKCNMAMHFLASYFGTAGRFQSQCFDPTVVAPHIPRYFNETSRIQKVEMDPLFAFLCLKEYVCVVEEDEATPVLFKDVQAEYGHFTQANIGKKLTLTRSMLEQKLTSSSEHAGCSVGELDGRVVVFGISLPHKMEMDARQQ